MNRLLIAWVALAASSTVPDALAGAENRYGWSLSASAADPFANTTAPSFGLRTVYLWYTCSSVDGLSAAEFLVVTTGLSHAATVPENGFLNAGSHDDLRLAVGGCPGGPVVAARLLMIDNGGNVCLAPSSQAFPSAVDCASTPGSHPIDWAGFSSGLGTCADGALCPPDAIEARSWGQLKALYR